jgi:hypothetical protein
MNSPIRLLRIAYWTGIIADAATLLPLLVPAAAAAMLGIHPFTPGSDYRYASAIGASLMAGWTALLIWADRKPLERSGVLLLTVCPVLIGLISSGGYAISSGLVRVPYLIPVFVFQIGASALFLAAYSRARAYQHTIAPHAGSR